MWMNIEIMVADSWRKIHADARVGLLALRNVGDPTQHPLLDERKHAIEVAVRARFAGKTKADLNALDTIKAYNAFYKPFNKTYHVLLQLESIALKGKPIASATALVQAMFMAELNNQLLTAGHNLDVVVAPVTIAASRGDETYTRINGQTQTLKANDMYMHDAQGILSSVIYGPDQRTQITAQTRHVFFVTYAPKGIGDGALQKHLADIEEYVRLVSPEAEQVLCGVLGD
jgi:DNA/RNA-binding domain of Phe-tRNA-synthetase-like protein